MTSMSNNTQKHFIVEQIPLPTWVSDENGLILYCNIECTEYWLDTFSPLPAQWLDIYPTDLDEVKTDGSKQFLQKNRIKMSTFTSWKSI